MSLITLNLLPQEEVDELHKTTKPVVRYNGVLYTIKEGYDLCHQSYLWSPVRRKKLDESKLVVQADHQTLHKCGHPSLFKPSVQEVLSCIHGFMLSRVVDYYEMIEQPQGVDDLNQYRLFTNNFIHVGKVRLYYEQSPIR